MPVKDSGARKSNRLNVRDNDTSHKPDSRLAPLEDELKSTRYELESLLDNSPDAIRFINKDFSVRLINRAFAEITGADQNDVVGKKCWDVFPSPLCHTSECRLQRVLDGEKDVQVEIERKKKDGSVIPCIATTTSLRDESGELIGIIEQFRDVTEYHRMEDQVKESEARYQALMELGTEAGEAIVILQDITEEKAIQTFVNYQWPKITGYTIEELLGKPFLDLLTLEGQESLVNRGDRKRSGEAVSGLCEVTVICKNGTRVPVEFTEAMTTYQGKPANILYIRDISERKRIEEALFIEKNRYQSLFEDAPVAIWELDLSEVKEYFEKLKTRGIKDIRRYIDKNPKEFVYYTGNFPAYNVNRATFALYEAENVEELKKSVAVKVRESQSNLNSLKAAYLTLADGAQKASEDLIFTSPKGDKRYHHVEYSVATGYESTWGRVFVCVTDVTETKRFEQDLMKHKYHLEEIVTERTAELQKSKQREEELFKIEHRVRQELEDQLDKQLLFNRAIVHELKTPLTAILVSSEALIREANNAQTRPANNIYNSALILNSRINELLDVAKGEIGMLKLNPGFVNIAEMIEGVTQQISLNVNKRKQSLKVEVSPVTPGFWGDAGRLQQVIFNLIDNALKFNRKQGKIVLRVYPEESQLFFEVQDEGPGISVEDQEYIFQPYNRAKKGADNLSGLGLGLYLSKMLVELHGGRVYFNSEEGRGSTIGFSIPLKTDENSGGRF
jgi:PAS domain S-box-containing protein